MKFLKDIRRRSATTFRRLNVSSDSHLSSLSNGSSNAQNDSASSPNVPALSPDTTSSSSSNNSPSPSEFALPIPEELPLQEALHIREVLPEKFPPYSSPQILNFGQGQMVSHQVVFLEGQISGDRKQDGTLAVRHAKFQSPVVTWPVMGSRFKALVYLHSGTNIFALEFTPSGSRSRKLSSNHRLIYHPMTSCPPIRLVVLIPKDSTHATEDRDSGTTALSVAMAKYRMAAYLWQAFVAEAMSQKNGIRRTFQLENEWKESTLFSQDFLTNEMRSEAPVHAVVLEKTRDEIRASAQSDVLACIETALSNKFTIPKGQKSYFACLLLNSNDEQPQIPGFSYGGPLGEHMNIAIYHDQALAAYPSSIDRVTAAFSDESSTPQGPDATRWRSASHGIGRHLREVARMLGLPEQDFGLVSDECARLAASFSLHAAHKLPEPRLHPLDRARLRHHATLRSPFGPTERVREGTALAVWAVGDGAMFVASPAGIVAVEVYGPGESVCRHWMAVADKRGAPRFTLQLSLADIIRLVAGGRATGAKPSPRLSARVGPWELRVLTADGVVTPVVDFEATVRRLVLPNLPGLVPKRPVYKCQAVGVPAPGSAVHSVVFPAAKRMCAVVVRHSPGASVAGVEFVFEEDSRLLVGRRAGGASKEWALRIGDGEMLMGMEVRVDGGVRGLRLFASSGRLSPWFGDASGGGVDYKLIPPPTFRIVGLEAHAAEELSSLQFLVAH